MLGPFSQRLVVEHCAVLFRLRRKQVDITVSKRRQPGHVVGDLLVYQPVYRRRRAPAFHGGELYRASETSLELCSKSGCSTVTARLDGGLYTYTVTGMVSAGERRVVASNNDVEWTQNGEQRLVSNDFEQRLRNWVMAKVYFCFLPFRLNDPGVLKEDKGLDTWSDRGLHKVKVTFGPAANTDEHDEYVYWFDPQSGRLEQFAYSYTGSPGGLRFRRLFNYRRTGGILFFDQENWGVEGPGLRVDLINPEFFDKSMHRVSTVELKNIVVRSNSS